MITVKDSTTTRVYPFADNENDLDNQPYFTVNELGVLVTHGLITESQFDEYINSLNVAMQTFRREQNQ